MTVARLDPDNNSGSISTKTRIKAYTRYGFHIMFIPKSPGSKKYENGYVPTL